MLKILIRRLSPAWLYELAHRAKVAIARTDAADYSRFHARSARRHCRVRGRRVLVIGCNTGGDCRYFVGFGAAAVVGLDVIPTVGSAFRHSRVQYCRASAETMPFADGSFDLVYSVATMEHVPDIARAFAEIARVTAPGGTIYSYAAPLWNSRFGHHKGDLFPDAPWIHLRMTSDEIVRYADERGITAPKGIEHHVRYMLNDAFFNKIPGRSYVNVCRALSGIDTIRNEIEREPDSVLPGDIARELAGRGYCRDELLGAAHLYIARKL